VDNGVETWEVRIRYSRYHEFFQEVSRPGLWRHLDYST
jgi:hypothetical protein